MKRTLLIAVFLIAVITAVAAIAQDAKPHPALPSAPADIPRGPNAVGIRIWLSRIHGDVSGEMSLTDALWEGVNGGETNAHQGPYSFFTLAKLTIAGVKFQADQNGWKWDGKDEPPSGGRVEQIAAPRILLAMPNSFFFQVGSDVPIQYFRKRPDGLFELALADQSTTGMIVTALAEKGKADRILLRDFSIGTRLVEKRKPIEGVNLDVGEPVIGTKETKITIAVKPNLDYGILFSSDGIGSLLLRLRLDMMSQ